MSPWLGILSPFIIAISTLVSASLVLYQLRVNYNLAIREKAIGYSVYANKDLREARALIDRSFGPVFTRSEAIPTKDIDAVISEEPEVELAILTILAHWENMALAIKSGIADNEVCRNMAASSLIQNTRVFRSFIDRRRELNPRYYMNLIHLRRQWESELGDLPTVQFNPVLKI